MSIVANGSSMAAHPFHLPKEEQQMPRIWRIALVVVAIAAFSSFVSKAIAQSSVYYVKETSHKANVEILAISSSIHVGSGSQEIYLADVSFQKGAPQMAKLVDQYPANGYPVRHALLREHRALQMGLIRHEQCDVKRREFFLPNDPDMVLDAKVRAELEDHAETIIHCYRVVHDATRLAKK